MSLLYSVSTSYISGTVEDAEDIGENQDRQEVNPTVQSCVMSTFLELIDHVNHACGYGDQPRCGGSCPILLCVKTLLGKGLMRKLPAVPYLAGPHGSVMCDYIIRRS